MTKEVKGWRPKLTPDGKPIPLADKYNLVLPMFETKPAAKAEPLLLESTEKKEPKFQRYPYPCPDCGEMNQWTNGKIIWCSQCFHK